ncbi:hypothetical protein A464_752 [Salmonella bongori N268-08]|uniref:Uncharacterized protein n=1 Tax=Salmonella bongori N268-08 TaxID=1197719 RepID=S5MTL5_SALBN|nr:hypothetical protein A464_752 [Salmonella bongori N268-08]
MPIYYRFDYLHALQTSQHEYDCTITFYQFFCFYKEQHRSIS